MDQKSEQRSWTRLKKGFVFGAAAALALSGCTQKDGVPQPGPVVELSDLSPTNLGDTSTPTPSETEKTEESCKPSFEVTLNQDEMMHVISKGVSPQIGESLKLGDGIESMDVFMMLPTDSLPHDDTMHEYTRTIRDASRQMASYANNGNADDIEIDYHSVLDGFEPEQLGSARFVVPGDCIGTNPLSM